MLILCSGPDTWNARQKARELTEAFRAKHDPSGFSIETVQEPRLVDLIQRLGAPSFFSSKRFIRCDGIFDAFKIADIRALLTRLEADKDQTIIVTVEEEAPTIKVLDECKRYSFFHYTHPLLTGEKFYAWCRKCAEQLGASVQDAEQIARYAEGDAWLAEQELMKRAANPGAPLAEVANEGGSIFEAVETYLAQRPDWRFEYQAQDPDQFLTTLVSQVRSLIRVRDGEAKGIHPYVVKKFSTLKVKDPEQIFLRALQQLVATRTGLAQSSEVETRM